MLLKRLSIILFLFSLLSSCITTKYDEGVIIAEEKITTHTNKNHTQNNIISIAGSGVMMGSTTLFIILAAGGNIAASESLALIGAATGYGLIAGIGGITSLEIYRHIIKKSNKNHDIYKLTIQSLTNKKKLYISEQNYPLYPLNTKVKVLKRNGLFFVRKSLNKQ